MPTLALLCLSALSPFAVPLTGAQRRYLRAYAGRLTSEKLLPRALVLDPAAGSLGEIEDALSTRELVRCKLGAAKKKAEARSMATELATRLDAEVAQVIGHTCLLYRQSPQRIIELPPE